MPVMKSMRIIVTDYPAIVALENTVIDVRQIIANHPATLIHPNFTTQHAVSVLCGQ
jgi:hypothetical protein